MSANPQDGPSRPTVAITYRPAEKPRDERSPFANPNESKGKHHHRLPATYLPTKDGDPR